MNGSALVAGHLCLDVIPRFEVEPADSSEFFSPGRMHPIESTQFSCGGAVANTGGALIALGIDTRLLARVGDDGIGADVERSLRTSHPGTHVELRIAPGEATSYSIIVSSPRFDRIIFHYPGANDSFTASDVSREQLGGADLLHFGYPPAMRAMYENEGEELSRLFVEAKEAGLTTSLDLCFPMPGSEAASVDWPRVLQRVLPDVDLFLPGLEELRFMLSDGRDTRAAVPELSVLRETADWALSHGCGVCVLKMGADGLYVRTADDRARIEAMGRAAPHDAGDWTSRELLEPCFVAEARETTGAGDVTIAGFLAGLLGSLSLQETSELALAAGAASVESTGGTARLPHWQQLLERANAGWKRRQSRISL